MYKIIDTQTKQQVGGLYQTRQRASRRVDRLDNAYGAYRYTVQMVQS